jgi:Tetratricopeptide repeat
LDERILAANQRMLGDLRGALTLLQEVLTVRRRVLGDGHPDTLATIDRLAEVQHDYDRL